MTAKLENLSSAAAQKASEALSKLTGRPAHVEVVRAEIRPVTELVPAIGPEEVVVGVCLPVTGDATGASLLVFPKESALVLADLLAGREPGTTTALSGLDESALKEVGNILTGAYLAVLADASGVWLVEHVPNLTCDMFGAIASQIVAGLAQEDAEALIVEVEFAFQEPVLKSHLILFFGAEDARMIFPAMALA